MKESAYLTNINKSSAPHSAGILSVFSHFNLPLRALLVGLLMLLGSVGAWGQDLYVIHNGTNILSHNATTGAVITTRVTTFDPTTCFWTISGNYLRPVNSNGVVLGNFYLRPRSGNYTYSLNTNTSTNYAAWNGLSDGGQPYYNNRYLRLNGTTWEVTNTNSYRGTLRAVTVTSVISTSTNPTINGADVLTATGTSNYTATGAAYSAGGYINYSFNSDDYYFYNNTAITPANATIGTYTWTLTDNAYATVNNSGVVTVSSLPESDVTLTLTATTTATGGTPAAPAGTTLTGTKEITIQGTTPSAPIINVSGTNVTLSTEAAGTTSIRYTLDGTDPTETSGTVYSGEIDLSSSTNSPVTIKAVTVRNGNASAVTTQEATLTLPDPVITVDGTAGTATISATSGATIYYTTDGSTPTTSSSLYSSSLSGLATMTTIKAIAMKDGWNNSSVVSTSVTIPSGVSGGTVTLFDYEDHNWSYYSDKPDTDYPDVLNSPDPRNVKIIYDGNGGEVSYNESENKFVYYKTIEKINGTYTYKVIPNPFSKRPTVGTGNNRWRGFGGWKIISGGEYINGHNNNDVLLLEETLTLTGLDAGYTKNCTSATIELQATWVQAYVATQGSGNITSRPASLTGTTYETNFIVITDNTNHTVSGTGRVTISNRYPDGTAGGNGTVNGCTSAADGTKIEFANISGTFTEASGPLIVGRGCTGTVNEVTGTNANRVKNIRLESGTYSFVHPMQGLGDNAANRGNFVFGCDYDRAQVTTAQPYGDNSKLRIVVFTSLNSSGGHANNNTDDLQNITVKSGYYGFTSDFTSWQTNKNDGWGLGIGGNSDNFSDNYVVPDENGVMRTYTYGTKPPQNTMSFYVGPTRGGGKGGKNYLRIEGGELSSINGGGTTTPEDFIRFDFRMTGGWVKGALYGGASATDCSGSSKIVITGGEVNSWIGGGCNGTDISAGAGATNGTIYIYAGGNAQIRSHNSDGVYNNAWGLVNYIEGGQIFGGGRGMGAPGSYSGSATNSYVVVADDSYVEQNVYGGSCHGVSQYGYVYILGGTVGKKVFGGSFEPTSTNETWQAKDTHVRMYGGLVKEGIYGGNDAEGTVTQNTEVLILGGQVGTDVNNPGYVFGGGYGANTRVSRNVNVSIGSNGQTTPGATIYGDVYGGSALGYVNGTAVTTNYNTNVTLNKGIINGSLYGGGLGDNSTAANVYGPVTVTVNGGTVNTTTANGSGAVYGCNNINGSPKSTVTVTVNGTDAHVAATYYQKGETLPDGKKVGDVKTAAVYAIDGVYGGGNQAHYDPDPSTTGNYPTVTINGCDLTSIKDVFGGGNAAAVPYTNVTVNGGYIDRVFAGGNGVSGTPANVGHKNTNEGDNPGDDYEPGTASVNIYGGTINQVFGGSNAHGVIRVSSSIDIDKSKASGSGCDYMRIAEVYRGGNEAPGKLASLTIGSTGTLTGNHSTGPEFIGKTLEGIGDLYGGSRKANNTGYTALNITSGIINRVFGGNNIDGNVTGDIAVTINKTDSHDWYVGNVFGGGNLAAYSGSPTVTLTNGTVSHSVYGGGNEAGVGGSLVNINGGGVVDGIYGGCNTSGTVTGNITVNINGGTLGTSSVPLTSGIFGGGFGKDTGTDGNVDVNIGDASHSPTIYGDVYGGSALGNVNSDTEDYTHVTLTAGTIYGDVYGGGLGQLAVGTVGDPGYVPAIAALVKGNVKVTQNGVAFGKATTTDDESHTVVTAGRIFGCNNLNGSPKGTVLVLVSATAPVGGGSHTKGTYEMAAVYGGGNLAAYDPTNPNATGQYPDGSTRTNKPLQVVINGCQEVSIEYVYGGGNAAPTPSTDVLILGAFEIGNAFGGGNGKDKYTLDGGATWNANNGADVGYKGSDTYGTGKSELSLLGGTIHHAFGGSNTLGNVREESIAYLDESDPTCPLNIDEVYGGGNEAPMDGSSQVNLGCISYLKEIYGGAKHANVGGDIVLTITSGRFERVFGGNNLGGTINGSITVNIEETGCHPIVIGELYGCGNQASYTTPDGKDDPTLNVKSFTSIGQIFGGGFGASATVKGNPVVNINVIKGEKNNGDVPDGTYNYDTDATEGHFDTDGNFKEWTVEFQTSPVTVPAHSKGEIGAIGNVFGGGNAAKVDGNTEVNIGTEATVKYTSDAVSAEGRTVLGADIRYNIYGGGNQADVTGKTNVTIGPE